MSVVITTAELNIIWSTRTAQQGYTYVCEDGFLYVGQVDGTLVRKPNTNLDEWQRQRAINQSLPIRTKTIVQGVSEDDGSIVDVKITEDGKSIIELPANASTESTQNLILNELKDLNTSQSGQGSSIDVLIQETSDKLGQYNQIELLTLIYEELQQQTKLLKKIYQ
jgi:hypothetical protein